ncbi:MAG TPA: helix-turn-helix transcriptional regulator [Candidatus Acidoferrales bacterium]
MALWDLRAERISRGWSQSILAQKLGVSQPYVVMLEKGKRTLTPELARKLVRACRYSPAFLAPDVDPRPMNAQRLAESLKALGYPGYAYLRSHTAKRNPAAVLLAALRHHKLEARLVEALPWLILQYWNMDFTWLLDQAKQANLQNRLGFVVSLARRLAERTDNPLRNQKLAELESALTESKLAKEDFFLAPARTASERRWMLQNRSAEAEHWNLVTDLKPEHLPSYAS